MTSMKVREYLRTHLLGFVAIFIALAGTALAGQSGGGDGPKASASVVTEAKFKKLKKRVAALDQLNQRVAALETKPAQAIPTTLPPSGTAGGDLTGSYPNPLIAPGAVDSEKVINQALTSDDLGPGSVDEDEISAGAVTGQKLKLSDFQFLNFGAIAGETCAGLPLSVSTPGIGGDNVVVTPPPGFPATFTLTGVPDPANNQIDVHVCNHFPTGSVDPDGSGTIYQFLVIE